MDFTQTISHFKILLEPLGSIAALLWIVGATRSVFVLRTQAWKRVFGKEDVTHPVAIQFVEEQISLASFVHHSKLKVQTIPQMVHCKAWLERYDIGPRQLRAIVAFFDLTTMEFRKNLPNARGAFFWLCISTFPWIFSLAAPVLLWSPERAYYYFRSDGYAFSATDDDMRTVNRWWRPWGDHQLLKKDTDCGAGTSRPLDGFSAERRAQLCEVLRDARLPGKNASTIGEQRNLAFGSMIVAMLGVVATALHLLKVQATHALRKKVQDADRQPQLDFGEGG